METLPLGYTALTARAQTDKYHFDLEAQRELDWGLDVDAILNMVNAFAQEGHAMIKVISEFGWFDDDNSDALNVKGVWLHNKLSDLGFRIFVISPADSGHWVEVAW